MFFVFGRSCLGGVVVFGGAWAPLMYSREKIDAKLSSSKNMTIPPPGAVSRSGAAGLHKITDGKRSGAVVFQKRRMSNVGGAAGVQKMPDAPALPAFRK